MSAPGGKVVVIPCCSAAICFPVWTVTKTLTSTPPPTCVNAGDTVEFDYSIVIDRQTTKFNLCFQVSWTVINNTNLTIPSGSHVLIDLVLGGASSQIADCGPLGQDIPPGERFSGTCCQCVLLDECPQADQTPSLFVFIQGTTLDQECPN